MRVVGGSLKGRPLTAPAGDGTRPTHDRVREALMSSISSLGPWFEDAVVLDAFAGSGALGIECVSRGARLALLCERDAAAQRAILANLSRCQLGREQACLVRGDVFRQVDRLATHRFDLVLLDPPYALRPACALSVVQALAARDALAAPALTVYEHDAARADEAARAAEALGMEVRALRRYGAASVLIARVADAASLSVAASQEGAAPSACAAPSSRSCGSVE
ncbi:methyltransferase [Berryella wangjianweii]|uniref:Methyltransferase n=1 Tax=Berryella wangjianweii TaxID=2734634 RepID=A0A6M8J0X0_9ACTN|nr:RsmD family RNA methyltransferase [Berryella wangjianweii]QKF06791.1 methyltransferase [Berryella wangjianweii]